MVLGIAGGLAISGMIMGALSGSFIIFISLFGAGLLIAGISAFIDSCRSKATINKLVQYPPYGY